MKTVLAASLVLLLTLITLPVYAAPDWVRSVVQIKIGTTPSSGARGSAVAIYSKRIGKLWFSYLITNEHNTYVKKLTPLNKTGPGKKLYKYIMLDKNIYIDKIKTTIIKKDSKNDLALIRLITTTRPKFRPTTISSAPLNTNNTIDGVFSIGFPYGYGPSITFGYVSITRVKGRPFTFLHSAAVAPGNSGGGVFRNGKLVGISVRVGVNPNNEILYHIAYAIRIEYIIKLMEGGYERLLTIDSRK